MPIYSVYPERYCNCNARPLPFWPCDVKDAHGDFLDGTQHYVDTDTGITIGVICDRNGQPLMNSQGTQLMEVVELHPAPLTVVPYDPANHANPAHVVTGG